MAVQALKCKECGTDVSARGALRLRALLRAARGRLRPRRARPRRARSGRSRPGPHDDLALRRLPAVRRRRPRPRCRAGLTPLVRADRLAERLGLGELWVKNDAANPTHSFKDRVVVGRARARRSELGFDDRRLRLDRQPRQRGRRARRRRRARRPTSSSRPTSRSRSSSPPASTARNLVGVRGNYDDVNRLCTELARRARRGRS